MTSVAEPTLGAILLAGGRATRMDGAPKPLIALRGQSLLEAAIAAARAVGCEPVTVAGLSPAFGWTRPVPRDVVIVPPRPDPAVSWVRDDPPFSGPAAAVVAALRTWDRDPEWSFVLACDLPAVGEAVGQLRDDLRLVPRDTDGVCLSDASSRPQWLIGVYRTAALRRGAEALPDGGVNASMRALLDDLAIAVVAASDHLTADIDTWEDLERARQRDLGAPA